MSEFGKKLLKSMEEAVQIANGKMPRSEYREHIIQTIRAPEHVDVKSIRERMGMTQLSLPRVSGCPCILYVDGNRVNANPIRQPAPICALLKKLRILYAPL